jgi:hypothetical protein
MVTGIPWRNLTMKIRILPILAVTTIFLFLIPHTSNAEATSLDLIDAFTTSPGSIARVGFFDENSQIDLMFEFDVETDTSETCRLTWDVYDRYGGKAYSGVRELQCENGFNRLRVDNAIPIDLGNGQQVYDVYASVRIGSMKDDAEFEVRIQSPPRLPGVMIEDVRLTPREDNVLGPELGDAAIPYTLEIDFRVENIISWGHAEIRWHGITVDGFMLDNGLGATDVDEGFNTFRVDSFIARPSRLSTPEADFSVEVSLFGYYDSVTFPIETLPLSLSELRAARDVEGTFSIGDAYLVTSDGERSTFFSRTEPIIARILTGGIVPENTRLLMMLTGGPENSEEEFMTEVEAGVESPVIEYELPEGVDRPAGFYNFIWAVFTGGTFFAERITNLTISDREGFSIPVVIDLPGDATFTAPIIWDVTQESGPGLYATMVTPDGIVSRLLGQSMDEPISVNILADVFESSEANSGIPSDAVLLTTEEASYESEWESERRAYLGGGKVFVHEYILYRIGSGEYEFLISTSLGDEEQVTEAYMAADAIHAGIDLG